MSREPSNKRTTATDCGAEELNGSPKNVRLSVAIVTNIPRPYRRALFRTLRGRLAVGGRELTVVYTSDPSKHRRRGATTAPELDPAFEQYARGLTLRMGYERVVTIATLLGKALKRGNVECVISGGFGLPALAAAFWCRSRAIPFVLWAGAWPGQEGRIRHRRSSERRRLVRFASAYITYGTAAADYLISLGAPGDRVFPAWNTVDLEGIASDARAAASRRTALASKYQLAANNLLFVGSLVERKGLRELMTAALTIDRADPDWALHLVGAGPLEAELRSLVRAEGKDSHFRFHGLRPPGDVAELLGLVDGFVLPTKREAWGLVINEAMACGVPVVASPHAGATRDLIVDGVTGYVVEPTDVNRLSAAMSLLLSGNAESRAIGQAGAEAVRAKASLERSVEGFVAAIQCALEERKREHD